MKSEDVRDIAKTRGVHPGTYSKTEPIKTLQAEESPSIALSRLLEKENDHEYR